MTRRTQTRWLALARLSDKWRDDPLDRQTADLLDLVERQGGALIEPVLVERVSGSQYRPESHQRPGWERIMQAVKAGEVDGVAIYNLDRLTREPFAAEELIRLAAGGLLVADPATTVDLSNGDARHFFRGKIAAAAAESDAISRRTRRAFAAKRDAGRPHWSFRPFGFERDGTHHATEAPLVREAYERFTSGATLGALATWLNDQGVTQPERIDKGTGEPVAKAWTGGAVRLLLKAERNRGVQRSAGGRGRPVYDTKRADGICAIVDDATFAAAKRLLDTRAASQTTGNERSHLLSGLLVCDVCGRRLTSMPVSTGREAYTCRKDRTAGRDGCGLKVSAAPAEAIVRDEVLRLLADEGYREAIAVPGSPGADAAELLQTIAAAELRQAELVAMTKDPTLRLSLKTIQPELRDLADTITAAEAAHARLAVASPLGNLPYEPDLLAELWENWTLAQRQAAIAEVLEPVVIRRSTTRGRVFDPTRVVTVPRY